MPVELCLRPPNRCWVCSRAGSRPEPTIDRAFGKFLMTPLRPSITIGFALVAVALAVYWPSIHHDFINYDDPDYVLENQHVSSGLIWNGAGWAFGRLHGERTYWHPLTWISHMVDCQLFGLKPAGHHLMNVLFHLLNTVLVFVVFLRMTGALWQCVLLAGFFALHPLQVDTVAWVAERKNLLATFFGLLTIWAYASYAKAEGRMQNAEGKAQHRVSRPPAAVRLRRTGFTFHVSRWLPPVPPPLRLQPHEQAGAGDLAVPAVAPRLLAHPPPSTKHSRLKTQNSPPLPSGQAPVPVAGGRLGRDHNPRPPRPGDAEPRLNAAAGIPSGERFGVL